MFSTEKIAEYKKIVLYQFNRFSDIKFSGQVIFAIIVFLIFWSGARAVQSNFNLQKQIISLKQQNNAIKLQNTNIELQNQYFASSQYQELSARQNLGLGFPGESEILVPDNVALKYTVNLNISQKTKNSKNLYKESSIQKNFTAWINFFFHRI